MTTHSPTPYRVSCGYLVAADRDHVADLIVSGEERQEVNGAFIARACNSHDRLVGAARRALTALLDHCAGVLGLPPEQTAFGPTVQSLRDALADLGDD
jgi:hypothetical protein